MNRILSLDYGLVRVGMAVSDALKITAQSLDTLTINGDNNILLQKLAELKNSYNLDTVVIGYPKHMNGDLSETSRKIDELIPCIESLNLKVVKWDERLTTVMAHKTMKDLGIKQKEKKTHADRLAAMYILEDYLRYIS